MGTIRGSAGHDGQSGLVLSPVTRAGRATENELRLDAARVSQFHAVIAWVTPGVWEVRDLASSNGTFVDGALLAPHERRVLLQGSRLGFGEADGGWTLVDDARPMPEVWDLASGERILGTAHLLTVAGDDGPSDILEESTGHWVLERAGHVIDVTSGVIVTISGRRYRIVLPVPLAETEETSAAPRPSDAMGGAALTFLISADLETVGLRVAWADQLWESTKAYNRALLVLARARLRDAMRTQLAPHDRGWIYVDEVCTLADYDGVSRFNVEVHRARSDFARRGVPGAPTIVQRRRGTGQIRIGTERVTVVEGNRGA